MARTKRTVVETWATAGHIHWEIRWVIPDKEQGYRIGVKDCGHDLGEALRIYTKLKAAGRRMVTLKSCNAGFPPPEKYQPGWIKRKKTVEIGKGKRRRKAKRWVDVHVTPMRKLNRKGIFWCPYCRELRKFQSQSGTYAEAVPGKLTFLPYEGLYCPICGISHRDYHVRKWNPICARLYMEGA